MNIEVINETTVTTSINDLGIELQPGERINLLNIEDKYILESVDLPNSGVSYFVDGVVKTYETVRRYIQKLNEYDHIHVDTHAHNIRDDSFFDTEKINGKTVRITYYRDAAKTQKIREEQILRIDGVVDRIISTIYDDEENIIEIETQTLNRDVDGKVESITTLIED